MTYKTSAEEASQGVYAAMGSWERNIAEKTKVWEKYEEVKKETKLI